MKLGGRAEVGDLEYNYIVYQELCMNIEQNILIIILC